MGKMRIFVHTTSTFYTFKIRRSACPLFTPGRIAEMDDRSATVDMSRKKLAWRGCAPLGRGSWVHQTQCGQSQGAGLLC